MSTTPREPILCALAVAALLVGCATTGSSPDAPNSSDRASADAAKEPDGGLVKTDWEKLGYVRTKTEPTGASGDAKALPQGGDDQIRTLLTTPSSAQAIEDRQCDQFIEDFTKATRRSTTAPLIVRRLPIGMIIYSDIGTDVSSYLMIFPAGVLSGTLGSTPEGVAFSCVKEGGFYSGIRRLEGE